MKKTTLNWVLAHEPYHVFLKAAKSFSDEISAETNGEYTINVITLAEWNEQAKQDVTIHSMHKERIVEYVDNGMIDIATTYANTLGKVDKDLFSLSMPFLFDSDEQARGIIDGPIGQHMLAKVAEKSNVRGLVFTYSGGFRIIPSNKAVEKLEDFYKMNIGTSYNPVATETWKTVSANPVSMFHEDLAKNLAEGIVQGGETTYTRFFLLGQDKETTHINDNEHSLFLTSLIINKQLWHTLGEKVQGVFARAALRAAEIERNDSLADNVIIKKRAEAVGIPVIKMDSVQKARFVSATKGLYDKFNTYFSPGLLSQLTNGKI
jgi:TRAP-type C4-dicarboxylate transport system substrate-binding protein